MLRQIDKRENPMWCKEGIRARIMCPHCDQEQWWVEEDEEPSDLVLFCPECGVDIGKSSTGEHSLVAALCSNCTIYWGSLWLAIEGWEKPSSDTPGNYPPCSAETEYGDCYLRWAASMIKKELVG